MTGKVDFRKKCIKIQEKNHYVVGNVFRKTIKMTGSELTRSVY